MDIRRLDVGAWAVVTTIIVSWPVAMDTLVEDPAIGCMDRQDAILDLYPDSVSGSQIAAPGTLGL